jgi:aspartyl-tRNA(Asn)/glutamyl-tRNA(Gln) amidotransferase subunit C
VASAFEFWRTKMSHLNDEFIKKLVELSSIECSQEEREALLKDLEGILIYFDQLNEVFVENVSPCNHVLEDINNVLRDDVVKETMPRQVFLENAPAHTGGMIKVPPVIVKSTQQETEEAI